MLSCNEFSSLYYNHLIVYFHFISEKMFRYFSGTEPLNACSVASNIDVE